ncbi:MAG: S8 family serine peptidase, partial [Ignavibacteria bacterium]|nr:S8 family serine peptidase [Ignavibacteria bacterium]
VLSISSDKGKTESISHTSKYSKDHFIIKFKKAESILAASLPFSSVYESRINEVCASLNLTQKKIKQLFPPDKKNNSSLYNSYELETYYIVYLTEDNNIPELCDEVTKNSLVDFSEPDFIGEAAGVKGSSFLPNDQYFSKQWGLYNDGSERTTGGKFGKKGADMNVLKAWEIGTGSSEIVVGILDSGAKTDHPDLTERIWINKDEVKNGRDDDGNGFVDDINGYNFAYDNSSVRDDGGHGTNISGTVGATTNNSLGYAGIDQNCRLMICKNLDDDNLGEYSWWAASLYYASNNGAKVINMSEGGADYSKTLENAINYAYETGSLIVASMMNKNNGDSYYPASFKNVMAIGATDTDDSRCREFTWGGGSNWGKHISVVAPGNKIYGLDYKDNFNYDVYWSGTSQATAYVTGIASVLLGQDPSRTNSDLREIITTTSIDLVGDSREDRSGWDQYYGFGRVDLFEALNYGKYSSGKKETKEINKEDETPVNNDSESNSTRAKANDPGYDKKKDRDDDYNDKKARKPKADDR